jgi:hypothetical protein
VELKKPSDFFGKQVIEEKVDGEIDNISFSEELIKVETLTHQINQLQQELTQKVVKTDLEKLILSHVDGMENNFKFLRDDLICSNKKDIREFKEVVENILDDFNNLINIEIPKYKKHLINNEICVNKKFDDLKENVKDDVTGIRKDIDNKIDNIAEVIDNNLEYFNNQLQEASSEVKKTKDIYNKLSKIVENKISNGNEKLEEYSKTIQSLYESFLKLETLLKEENSVHLQLIEEKFQTISSDANHKIDNLNKEVNIFQKDISEDILNVKSDVVINEQHLKKVEKFLKENHQELVDLKEEVFGELEKLPYGDIQENVERLNKKIQYIEDVYKNIEPEVIVKEVIQEGLLNEPPSTKNEDPLTSLDQNFVTLDQLQQHYKLFLNRIQQQLSTLGGGGETRLKYLDDIVGISTNASAYDGKFLKYNHSLGKFEFETVTQGSGEYASVSGISTVSQGLTGTPNIEVGVVTAITYYGDGSNLSNIISGVGIGTTISNLTGTGVTTIIFNGTGISAITVSDNVAEINITNDVSPKITVGSTSPESPQIGDIWIYYDES